MKKKIVRQALFILSLSLLYAFTFILIDFINYPVSSFSDGVITGAKVGYMFMMTYILLWFLSINKYIFAATFPLLTVLCTALSYYKLTLHVELTQMIIDLAMVNDFRTSFDAISWQLMVSMLLVLCLSVSIVVYRFKYIKVWHEWIQLIIAFVLLVFIDNTFALSQPLVRHTPYSIYYAFQSYFQNKRIIAEERPVFRKDAVCHSDSLNVVFVLGESLRVNSMQINGYKRATTPYLMKEKNVVLLPHIYSEYGYTHESVPYILTRADHEHPDLAYKERSFISIMKQAGYRTTWLANQESVNTFIYFMKECDSLVNVSNGKSLFIISKWLDEDILPHYRRVLSESNHNKFILVHTVGSHWYYNNHYPDSFMRYKPVIDSKVISSNSHEQMVNAYDNTILYSDYIWHQLINELRNKKAILIYLADHSENMGEDGHYTHGDGDWPAQHYPACFVWYSDKYQVAYPDKIDALKRNKDKEYNTSFLFHSILDACDIRTSFIKQSENIFR